MVREVEEAMLRTRSEDEETGKTDVFRRRELGVVMRRAGSGDISKAGSGGGGPHGPQVCHFKVTGEGHHSRFALWGLRKMISKMRVTGLADAQPGSLHCGDRGGRTTLMHGHFGTAQHISPRRSTHLGFISLSTPILLYLHLN